MKDVGKSATGLMRRRDFEVGGDFCKSGYRLLGGCLLPSLSIALRDVNRPWRQGSSESDLYTSTALSDAM